MRKSYTASPETVPAKQFRQSFVVAMVFVIILLLTTILPGKLFAQAPEIKSFSPVAGPVGTLVTITGSSLNNPTAVTIGAKNAVVISNTGNVLVAMVMPGAATGAVLITTRGGTASGVSNFTVTTTHYPFAWQGPKLVGTGNTGAARQGYSVAVSADGNTAIVGGEYDNSTQGAAWVYTRNAGAWTQQGTKLVGTGNAGAAYQGTSVSLSADGNTAIVGGYEDDSATGAAWVYTRTGGVWTQQGSKLVGTGGVGAQQGTSVSLSADGNTAIVGGPVDNNTQGAVWIYTRSGGAWMQQGSKLVGTGGAGAASQGASVSLSADGNTAIAGGPRDNDGYGASWVYTRSGSTWTQQGSKLQGTFGGLSYQGSSVSLSADGNTAIVAGPYFDSAGGAFWAFTRSGGAWAQQGPCMGGTALVSSVSLSADGNTAITGGSNELYTRSGGVWARQGSLPGAAGQGEAVMLSADANTAIVGGYWDNSDAGAAWVYIAAPPPTISSFSPVTGPVGTLVTVKGSNFSTLTGVTIGGQSAIVISNTGSTLVAMVMPGSVTGTVSITTAAGTASGSGNFTPTATSYPSAQLGSKLVGTGNTGAARQGYSVAVSADGNTAIMGGEYDNSNQGAAWVYTRSAGAWIQQGSKLVGTGNIGAAFLGYSVSLSADGNTAIVGGYQDNSGVGAAWVYTRTGGNWTQQGTKLVGTGGAGAANRGWSVSLSADGNTAIVGGNQDNSGVGAAWIFVRSLGNWTQQGLKLVGTGGTGVQDQGASVSLSGDGNTAIVGGDFDNSFQGAAWIYARSGSAWVQQGSKLLGTGHVGAAEQGQSVSLSADGNIAIVGGGGDNAGVGAAWMYVRSGGAWTQKGAKLVGTGNTGAASQGSSVSLSADGNTAMVGGCQDNSGVGAEWVYTRSGSAWEQQGSKLVGAGSSGAASQGYSVSLSADGNTAIAGGYFDNSSQGAAWVYIVAQPTITSFSPAIGPPGTLIIINGAGLRAPTSLTIGGQSAIVVSNTGSTLVAMVMPGAATGTISITTAGGTASGSANFTITSTPYPSAQQGSKLVGKGSTGAALQGYAAAVSADGNTAIIGGYTDHNNLGAAWVFTRSGGTWVLQGTKLVGAGSVGSDVNQGISVSLSADGNTALVGGAGDNSGVGAAWIFTRSGGIWAQQGLKLVGTGNTGAAAQGNSVSLSADGNTAIVGGFRDNSSQGAAWVFTRSGGAWAQQGSKLVGIGNTGAAAQGYSVSLSADGNTAIAGGYGDNSGVGAAWVYTRNNGAWTLQGSKLVGTGSTGAAFQGRSVSLNADGNTAMVGADGDNSRTGAAWVYTRSGGAWMQQGSKLVGTGSAGAASQGISTALSADGNTAIVGGYTDNASQGAAWVYVRSAGAWIQKGTKLVGTGNTGAADQGVSVSLSADGNTAIAGGYGNNTNQGAAWVYIAVPSSNALLSTIELTPASTLTNTGTSGTTITYTTSVGNATASVTVTPTTEDPTATVKVNGTAVLSGTASPGISLVVGPNTITTVVTAPDGVTTQTYAITVTRAPSTIATLANLTLSSGTLSPAFGSGHLNYTASVVNTVSTITLTPTTTDATSTVKVNSAAVTSGTASSNIALAVGHNTITTIVTAQDGTTIKTYTVNVTRAPSSIATLANLTLSSGALSPAFGSGHASYTAAVSNATGSIKLTPTTTDGTATVKVNGTAVTSGTASANILLAVGHNTITTIVTAQDGTTTKTYTVTVTRAPSSIATLASLTLSSGILSPAFGSGHASYTASVSNAKSSITITPTTTDATATVKVNGTTVTSGTASTSLPLVVGHNTITTIVTAQDGTTTKTYTLTVTRAATGGLADNDFKTSVTDPLSDGVLVHQGLSPNGDGMNEGLIIEGINNYPENKLLIMSRNGVLVYEAKGYDNSSRRFDGHSNKNGKKQQPGTYFYSLAYKVDGVVKYKTGFIILKY